MIARAEALAARVLQEWGPHSAPRLVKARENVVFEVVLAGGRRTALRLHRPQYQSREAIEAELDWTAALARAGVPVPAPVATASGAWTAVAGECVASCVGWLEGEPMGHAGRALAGPSAARFFELGQLVARLHRATDALPQGTGAARPAWDAAGLLGEAPLWGRCWENRVLGVAERQEILAARAAAEERLQTLRRAGADFGLIHADILRENVLVGPTGLALIDFDDSGWGFRSYDLGTALVQNLEEPELAAMADALAAGYSQTRGRPVDAEELAFFTMLRCMASLGWIATRAAADDPRQRLYADRALRLARHLRAGTLPW